MQQSSALTAHPCRAERILRSLGMRESCHVQSHTLPFAEPAAGQGDTTSAEVTHSHHSTLMDSPVSETLRHCEATNGCATIPHVDIAVSDEFADFGGIMGVTFTATAQPLVGSEKEMGPPIAERPLSNVLVGGKCLAEDLRQSQRALHLPPRRLLSSDRGEGVEEAPGRALAELLRPHLLVVLEDLRQP